MSASSHSSGSKNRPSRRSNSIYRNGTKASLKLVPARQTKSNFVVTIPNSIIFANVRLSMAVTVHNGHSNSNLPDAEIGLLLQYDI